VGKQNTLVVGVLESENTVDVDEEEELLVGICHWCSILLLKKTNNFSCKIIF